MIRPVGLVLAMHPTFEAVRGAVGEDEAFETRAEIEVAIWNGIATFPPTTTIEMNEEVDFEMSAVGKETRIVSVILGIQVQTAETLVAEAVEIHIAAKGAEIEEDGETGSLFTIAMPRLSCAEVGHRICAPVVIREMGT